MADSEIIWEAPEFEHRPKTLGWYWASIGVAVVLIGIAVWQKNFLFGIFVVIAEMLVLIWGEREPETVTFMLDERGIAIGPHRFHSYRELTAFSAELDVSDEWTHLFLHFESHFKPSLRIHVSKEDFPDVRKRLRSRVTELEHHPSLLEVLEHFLGF